MVRNYLCIALKTMKSACLECGRPLAGRSDKKFCDVHCKNAWHNQRNSRQQSQLKQVNAQINSNFRILSTLNERQVRCIHRNELENEGYFFGRSTETLVMEDDAVVYFCYNLGIKTMENGYFALTTKE